MDGEEVPAFVDEDKLMMIPDRSSPEYLEAAPLEPVVAGSQSVKINCDDLAKFKAGDVIVFSPGTAETEVAKVGGIGVPQRVYATKTKQAQMPKRLFWSWQLQGWRVFVMRILVDQHVIHGCVRKAIATTVSASIRPRNVHANQDSMVSNVI